MTKIGILIFHQVEEMDFVAPFEVLSYLANFYKVEDTFFHPKIKLHKISLYEVSFCFIG